MTAQNSVGLAFFGSMGYAFVTNDNNEWRQFAVFVLVFLLSFFGGNL